MGRLHLLYDHSEVKYCFSVAVESLLIISSFYLPHIVTLDCLLQVALASSRGPPSSKVLSSVMIPTLW